MCAPLIELAPAALLPPESKLALLPRSEPVATGAEPAVPVVRSTADPVDVTPGCVTPVPVELAWGALGLAPDCANAIEELVNAMVAAAKINFFICLRSVVFPPRLAKSVV